MRYRVEQLASACDVSVDTVRYYQSRGLLPPPEKEGRLAWYGPEHAERIVEIRSLQRKGLTLAAIRRVVSGELGPADADLAAAVAAARGEASEPAEPADFLTLEAFSDASGVPASLIQAATRITYIVTTGYSSQFCPSTGTHSSRNGRRGPRSCSVSSSGTTSV